MRLEEPLVFSLHGWHQPIPKRSKGCLKLWKATLTAAPAFVVRWCSVHQKGSAAWGNPPIEALLEEAEGVCWGELLKAPAFSGGGIESLFWVREANCSYGELNPSQLARLGSRGKAARALAPRLRERLGLNR